MTIDAPLFEYQRRTVERLNRLKVGALYIEQGTGKTRIVLELTRLRLEAGKIDGLLWMCSCSSLTEIERRIAFLTGGDTDFLRVVGLESLSHSWRLTQSLIEYAKEKRLMLVVDGGELIKSTHALRTARTLELSRYCPYRLLLSEVPLTRSVEDMFSQWYLLDWRILGYQSFWSFSMNHLELSDSSPGKRRARNLEYLLKRINPYVAQVLRKDCHLLDQCREYVFQFRLPSKVLEYYRAVVKRFLELGSNAPAAVYRLLGACQQMSSGRAITSLRPVRTEPLYQNAEDNPRIQALIEVLSYYPDARILILYRFRHEATDILTVLRARYPHEIFSETGTDPSARILIMNRMCAGLDPKKLGVRVIIHYSHDWDWGSRRRAEQPLPADCLTIVSLVAVETIDGLILDCLKHKKDLAAMIEQGLLQLLDEGEKHA